MLCIEFSQVASKFLDKAEQNIAQRLMRTIESLEAEPFPKGVTRVENQWFEKENVFRIRVGDYRILYSFNSEKKRVMIVNIDNRGRAYKN